MLQVSEVLFFSLAEPALVAKSSVVFDVKPWDDETDMKEMEKAVRAVQSEGLVWGASKFFFSVQIFVFNWWYVLS